MILVTGGLGFIGSHTVRALLDAGEECVLLQRRPRELPSWLTGAQVAVEQGDIADLGTLRAAGSRHDVTGIVHLAGSFPRATDPAGAIGETRGALDGLLNVVQAAQEWGVRRLGVASTIGVYSGLRGDTPLREDMPLPMDAPVWIPTFKKIAEMLGGHLADAAGLDIVNYRISGTWGPLGHDDPFFAAPALIHAAARGTAPDLSDLVRPASAEDGLDLTYVKDTGRALALLQLAGHLNHRTYNVGSGRCTTNAEISAAVKKFVPDAQVDLPAGAATPLRPLDITRLHEDTGYQPQYDTEQATADYLTWLRAGNAR